MSCDQGCLCEILECMLECCEGGGKKSPCACGNGEARLDVTVAPSTIDLNNDGSFVKLPPAGEFSTNLSSHELDFDDGGGVARLRYTGEVEVIAKIDAVVSLERVRPSIDQHIVLALNVGQAPSAATVELTTRQKTDLQSDGEDIVATVQGTFKLEPGDIVEVWVAKQDPAPGNEAKFQVTGFVLTAIEIRRVLP